MSPAAVRSLPKTPRQVWEEFWQLWLFGALFFGAIFLGMDLYMLMSCPAGDWEVVGMTSNTSGGKSSTTRYLLRLDDAQVVELPGRVWKRVRLHGRFVHAARSPLVIADGRRVLGVSSFSLMLAGLGLLALLVRLLPVDGQLRLHQRLSAPAGLAGCCVAGLVIFLLFEYVV